MEKKLINPIKRAENLILLAAFEGVGSNSTEFDLVTAVIGETLWRYQYKAKNINDCGKYGKSAINISAAILTRVTGNSMLYKKPVFESIELDEKLIAIIENETFWGMHFIGDNIKLALEQVACDFSVALDDRKSYITIMNILFYVENVLS